VEGRIKEWPSRKSWSKNDTLTQWGWAISETLGKKPQTKKQVMTPNGPRVRNDSRAEGDSPKPRLRLKMSGGVYCGARNSFLGIQGRSSLKGTYRPLEEGERRFFSRKRRPVAQGGGLKELTAGYSSRGKSKLKKIDGPSTEDFDKAGGSGKSRVKEFPGGQGQKRAENTPVPTYRTRRSGKTAQSANGFLTPTRRTANQRQWEVRKVNCKEALRWKAGSRAGSN